MRGPERRQQVVEQRDRGVRVDGGALPEGLVPPGSARISGMPSSAIHVLWPYLRPCGVSPSLTGSQQASGASPAGCSPLPGR